MGAEGYRVRLPLNPVTRYALAIFALGVVAVAWGLRELDTAVFTQPAVWAFAVLILAGELMPVTIRRRNLGEQLMASSTFSFALLLYAGPAAAILAITMASLIADAKARRRWDRILFNTGQYAIAFAVAGWVLGAAGHDIGTLAVPFLSAVDLWPLIPAWIAVFSVNHILVGLAVALDQRTSVTEVLLEDLPFQLLTSGVLLALAPVVVVVASRTLWLLPCLLIPVFALHQSTKQSVADAERAQHDSLTELPNRGRFQELVRWSLEQAGQRPRGALLVADLNRFGEINDTLGHRAGDELLRQVADRIGAAIPDEAILARLGGDEFGVLAPGIEGEVEALGLADQILEATGRPFSVEQFSLHIRLSMGLVVYPRDGEDTETLLRRADVAIHEAKRLGTGAEAYSTHDERHSRRRLQLANDLRVALDEGQLQVHFQPKADLRRNAVLGVEALARWTHPTLGPIGPDEFVPLAERAGLIDQLTTQVLDTALSHCALWRRAGFPLHVAVNLSMQSVHQSELPGVIDAALRRWDVSPSDLHLEITETMIMADSKRATATLDGLRDLGVQIAIDDFGTGYSSLARLKQMPVSQLKMDKSFVRDMDRDQADAAIVRSSVELGRSLGMQVVAEGVENRAVWDALAELGCEQMQGYFLSRPLSADDLMVWLLKRLPDRESHDLIPALVAASASEGDTGAAAPAAGSAATPDGADHPVVTPLFKRNS